MSPKDTVWVLGDQLNVRIGALRHTSPRTHRILMVESAMKINGRQWHRQRLHFIISSMRHFAAELRDGLAVLEPLVDHVVRLLRGENPSHRPTERVAS